MFLVRMTVFGLLDCAALEEDLYGAHFSAANHSITHVSTARLWEILHSITVRRRTLSVKLRN